MHTFCLDIFNRTLINYKLCYGHENLKLKALEGWYQDRATKLPEYPIFKEKSRSSLSKYNHYNNIIKTWINLKTNGFKTLLSFWCNISLLLSPLAIPPPRGIVFNIYPWNLVHLVLLSTYSVTSPDPTRDLLELLRAGEVAGVQLQKGMWTGE